METIKLYTSDAECCGCAACMDVCPKQAIKMVQNKNSFLVPHVDEQQCIHCKKCLSVCQYKVSVDVSKTLEAYAASSNNTVVLQNSASGGCFAEIAHSVLLAGGVVFGCAFDQENGKIIVHHTAAYRASEIKKLQGSKYVQSKTSGIYKLVKDLANEGRTILFSGTPCQVAACKLFLARDYPNVFFVDIICHGVPSQSMFHAYIDYLQKHNRIDIKNVVFRDKTDGWSLHGSIIYQKKGKTYRKAFKTGGSSYYSLFLKAQTYRDSCYGCMYACDQRPGDITIGDYWGIEKVHPEYLKKNGGVLDESKGVSCLLVNSDKGKTLIEKFSNTLLLCPTTFAKVADYNEQLNHPSKEGNNRQTILKILNEQGYSELEKWFYKDLGIKGYLYKLYNLMPAEIIQKTD